MKNKTMVWLGLIILLVVVIIFASSGTSADGEYDGFATCLADSGAKFYGSYQCPHCATQKGLFGASEEYLPYIECGPLGGPQSSACQQASIRSYPTWEFADGNRITGTLSLQQLAAETGCVLEKDPVE